MIVTMVYSKVKVYELQYKGTVFMRRHSDAYMKVNELATIAGEPKDRYKKFAYANKLVKNRVHDRVFRAHNRLRGIWVPLEIFREIASSISQELNDALAPLYNLEPNVEDDETLIKTESSPESDLTLFSSCEDNKTTANVGNDPQQGLSRCTSPGLQLASSSRPSTPVFQFSSPTAFSLQRLASSPSSPPHVSIESTCPPVIDESRYCTPQFPCALCSTDPFDYNALLRPQIAYNESILDPYSNRPLSELFLPHYHPIFAITPVISSSPRPPPSGTQGYVIDGLYSIDGIQQATAPSNVDDFLDLTPWLPAPFIMPQTVQEDIPTILLPQYMETVRGSPIQGEQKKRFAERKLRPRR